MMYSGSVHLRSPEVLDGVPIHVQAFATAANLVDSGLGLSSGSLSRTTKQILDPQQTRLVAGLGIVVPFPQMGRLEVSMVKPINIQGMDRLSRDPLSVSITASFGEV